MFFFATTEYKKHSGAQTRYDSCDIEKTMVYGHEIEEHGAD
jgi:hypothetical protein